MPLGTDREPLIRREEEVLPPSILKKSSSFVATTTNVGMKRVPSLSGTTENTNRFRSVSFGSEEQEQSKQWPGASAHASPSLTPDHTAGYYYARRRPKKSKNQSSPVPAPSPATMLPSWQILQGMETTTTPPPPVAQVMARGPLTGTKTRRQEEMATMSSSSPRQRSSQSFTPTRSNQEGSDDYETASSSSGTPGTATPSMEPFHKFVGGPALPLLSSGEHPPPPTNLQMRVSSSSSPKTHDEPFYF